MIYKSLDENKSDLGVLRLPFCINVSDMDADTLSQLMDTLETKLEGKYFLDNKELTLSVLEDRIEKASDPRKFLYGPFIMVKDLDSGVRRITTIDEVTGETGCTIYAYDQIALLLSGDLVPFELAAV